MATACSPNLSSGEPTSDKDSQPPGKAPPRVAKKRTKTGCLTCRRRRIKCDELQPICQNCTKSRRLCQYKQFSFKDNMTLQRPLPVDTPHTAPGMDFMFAQSDAFAQGQSLSGPTPEPHVSTAAPTHLPHPFAPLRPRQASGAPFYNWSNPHLQSSSDLSSYNPFLAGPAYGDPTSPFNTNLAAQDMTSMGPYLPALFHAHDPFQAPHSTAPGTRLMPESIDTSIGSQFLGTRAQSLSSAGASSAATAYSTNGQPDYYRASQIYPPQAGTGSEATNIFGTTALENQLPLDAFAGINFSDFGHPERRQSSTSTTSASTQRGFTMLSRAFSDGVYGAIADRSRAIHRAALPRHAPDAIRDTTEDLEEAAIEVEDDDYFDVLSEDEEFDFLTTTSQVTQRSDLQAMQSLYNQFDLLRQRGIRAFIYPGIMDHYRAERVANPLRNEATARVFAHFISSTGPMLSAFERIPRVNPVLASFGSLPTAHLSLWTFTLPMQALHNQGLLHAMLAMASLHIAKLQLASITPSYKHYSWSVKRVHKAVGVREGRHDVAILAATLLLAFYEVMTADLIKWIPHLCGARQLILEIDYPGMAQQIANLKAERTHFAQFQPLLEDSAEAFIEAFPDLDAALIDTITLKQWPLGATDQRPSTPHARLYSITELSNFEVLQDLYWWYVKQDMVQSFISGDPPLMHYSHWTRCPPRAPLGQRGAVYGSFDHVILLIGRICDFMSRDVPRKVAWNEANGSRWPQASFYGMAPTVASYMPRAYAPTADDNTTEPPSYRQDHRPSLTPDVSLQTQTEQALAEWAALEDAYATLEQGLAVPGFTPLAEDEITHFNTPFGRVVHYESFNLAVLHMFVQLGRLLLARCHPSMPAAMVVAVGAAAAQTSTRACLIGRIAAGVTPLLNARDSLSPQLAGTFTDCTLPLFLAGVQYRDAAQRYWTVTRLHEIEERSGWASAGLCANGCETAWEKAGEMGLGQPYVRVRPDLSIV